MNDSAHRAAREEDFSGLRDRLARSGFHPSGRLGQNFLVDRNLLDAIVRDAAIAPDARVLEIGPGPGWLTRRLAACASRVRAIEIDSRLVALLRQELGALPNLEIVEGDVLDGAKRGLHPAAIDLLREGCVVVANLPYSVASPVLANLFAHDPPPLRAVVCLQKEVADRLLAAPGTAAYGPLTVSVRARAQVSRLRDLPPDVFRPRPRVRSTLLAATPRPDRPDLPTATSLDRLLKVAFGERRKQLAPRLRALLPPGTDAAKFLDGHGLPADARGEALSVDGFVAMARALASG